MEIGIGYNGGRKAGGPFLLQMPLPGARDKCLMLFCCADLLEWPAVSSDIPQLVRSCCSGTKWGNMNPVN